MGKLIITPADISDPKNGLSDKLRGLRELASGRTVETLASMSQPDTRATANERGCSEGFRLETLIARNAGQSVSLVRQIDLALMLIEAGDWGTCETCENKIPDKRLFVNPLATRCVRCQSIFERDTEGLRLRNLQPDYKSLV